MKRIIFLTAAFFFLGVSAGMTEVREKKDFPKPKIKLSRGDTIMIEQFLKRKQKKEASKLVLTLLCSKNAKKKEGSYACDTINLKPASK